MADTPQDETANRSDVVSVSAEGMDRRSFLSTAAMITAGAAVAATSSTGIFGATVAQAGESNPTGMVGLSPDWSGSGGVGDYAKSNGNTFEVVNTGHGMVRNREFPKALASATDTGEVYDYIIVGGGLAGLVAAHTLKKTNPKVKALVLEMADMFGGEAKQNELEVDGVRMFGPQGSGVVGIGPINEFNEGWTKRTDEYGLFHEVYYDLGLPTTFEHQVAKNTTQDIRIPTDHWLAMGAYPHADVGFYYEKTGMLKNPFSNGFRDAPIPESMKKDLLLIESYQHVPYRPDWAPWLDSMTYKEFLTKVVGVSAEAVEFYDPEIAVTAGLGSDAVSAFIDQLPAKRPFVQHEASMGKGPAFPTGFTGLAGLALPGGNATLARALVQKINPSAYQGSTSLGTLLHARLNVAALDKPDLPVRIRNNAMTVSVAHDGPPEASKGVIVKYAKDGQIFSVRAKGAIVATPQHVNKKICQDIPTEYREAMEFFHHAPVLSVNIAVRNWKFLDALGVSHVRWFEGLGFWMGLHRQILVDGKEWMPLDPSQPVVLTMYTGFLGGRGLPVVEQCTAARHELFALSHADVQEAVTQQMTKMFSKYGFNAERDIASMVTNKWGHAYAVPRPGMFFGRDGKPTAGEVLKQRFNRIAFAHSEIQNQSWSSAARQGIRAVEQMKQIT